MSSEIKNYNQSSGGTAVSEGKDSGKAADIMRCGVTTIRKEKSVYDAIKILVEKNISGLPVVDDTGLAGIISEKDVLKLMFETEFISGSVEDYMTRDIVTFDEQDSLSEICNCLIENHFRRVPIMHNNKLSGIISRADLIKANKGRFKPQGATGKSKEQKKGLLARDIMKCGLITVQKQTPIYEALEILASKHISGLPVVDDYMNLVGIISEKDMLKLLYDPTVKPGKTEDFMTKEVVSFNHDDSLLDVCECLINNDFRRVPILNQGKVVGIISRADVMVCVLKNKSAIFDSRKN
jgi:CBS-domain-containing membrane protein